MLVDKSIRTNLGPLEALRCLRYMDQSDGDHLSHVTAHYGHLALPLEFNVAATSNACDRHVAC